MVAPINTIKHYVHRANVTVASGAVRNEILAESVVAPATANAFSVKEGSIIKAIYIEVWILQNGATGTASQFDVAVEKLPGNTPVMTYAQTLNMGAYPNKKNIFFSSQGVLAAAIDGAQSMPIIRTWVLIPKGKQRFGLDDRLVVNVSTTGEAINYCGLSTYKEYI